MVETRKIQEGDIEYAKEHGLEKAESWKEIDLDRVKGYTSLIDGRIVAVGGVVVSSEGVGVTWAILTEDALRNIVKVYRIVRDFLGLFIETYDLRIVQALARVDFPQGISMLEHLGFGKFVERVKGHQADGTDSYLFVRSIK